MFRPLISLGALALVAAVFSACNTTRETPVAEVQPAPHEYTTQPIGPDPDLAPGAVTQYTFAEATNFGHPHVSNDGRWLAYSSTSHSMKPQIFVQRKGSYAATQLTFGQSSAVHPQISYDAKKLAFASDRDGKYRIYTVGLNGQGGLMEVSDPNYESLSPTWSPRGDEIAYMTRAGSNAAWMIAVRELRTGATRFLTEGSYPDWSPDGSRLVFQRVNMTSPGYTSLFTTKPDGTEITKVYHSDTHGAITPCWAGNQWILFSTVNKSTASMHRMNDEFFNADDIWMVKSDGTMGHLVTGHRLADWDPCFDHENNEIIYISNRSGVQNIFGAKTNLEKTWAESENSEARLFGGGR